MTEIKKIVPKKDITKLIRDRSHDMVLCGISEIRNRGDTCTNKALADYLGMKESRLSLLLGNLNDLGMIEMKRQYYDKRSNNITLTTKGKMNTDLFQTGIITTIIMPDELDEAVYRIVKGAKKRIEEVVESHKREKNGKK